MSFVEAQLPGGDDGVGVVVCRTGYTGERGYELIAANDVAVTLWDALVAAGADHGMLPCGLGARDTLRTEMGYPLHGQDISLDVTPNQARLGWAVGWGKDEFWGRDALLRREGGRARPDPARPGRHRPRDPAPAHGREPHPRRHGRRGHLGHVLADAEEGRRPRAGLVAGRRPTPRSASTCAAAARSSRSPSRRSSTRRPGSSDAPPREPARPAEHLPAARTRRTPVVVAARGRRPAPRWRSPRRTPAGGSPRQADAESWVGEIWAGLAEEGVDAVTLFEQERLVYGPMSLHA